MIINGFCFDKFIFQIFGQDLDIQTAGGKNNCLNIVVNQIGCYFTRRCHCALADTQFTVDDRRIIENECFRRRGRAALIQQGHRPLQNFFRVFTGIGHRRRTADKNGIGAVKTADPHEPADDIGEVRTENPAVDMQLIDNDVFQIHK